MSHLILLDTVYYTTMSTLDFSVSDIEIICEHPQHFILILSYYLDTQYCLTFCIMYCITIVWLIIVFNII